MSKTDKSQVFDFDFKSFSVHHVYNKLKNVKARKAAGYDEMPPKLIQFGATVLSTSLTPISNKAYATYYTRKCYRRVRLSNEVEL